MIPWLKLKRHNRGTYSGNDFITNFVLIKSLYASTNVILIVDEPSSFHITIYHYYYATNVEYFNA